MICQNSLEGNPIWMPEFRSFLSECAFLGFSSGNSTVWSQGKLRYNDPSAVVDEVVYREIRRVYGHQASPDWADEALGAIDAALPDPMFIFGCLDDASTVISSSPAPFRLPQSPCPEDLAKCLFAARALYQCREELVFPIELDMDEAYRDLQQAAHLCAMIGGEKALLTAMVWAGDERSFA